MEPTLDPQFAPNRSHLIGSLARVKGKVTLSVQNLYYRCHNLCNVSYFDRCQVGEGSRVPDDYSISSALSMFFHLILGIQHTSESSMEIAHSA